MKNNRVSSLFSNRARVILPGVALTVIALGLLAFYLLTPPELTVHFINVCEDVAVGDSILLQSSEGKVVLIDGGEKGSGALEYLVAQNITHIDTVVLTHAHDDHFGGLIDVLKAIPVDEVVTNGEEIDEPPFQEFLQAVRESGAKTRVVKSGDKLPFGRLTFQVLSPRKINPTSVNNNSIVTRLAVGKVSFLFTGDTMELEEGRLVYAGAPLKVDILKVPHHGIDTSSSPAFLVAVSPSVAIYSVGAGKPYDAPADKTIQNLTAVGAEMYGTEVYGTITVFTDGRTYTINTEREAPEDN